MSREVEGEVGRCAGWVQKLIKDKLGVECKVSNCRRSGPVIIAKVEGKGKKREIMRNKYRLKGGRIFIQNLKWEDRKIQEKINKWREKQKGNGTEIKVGLGRVRIRGVWKAWAEIEKEKKKRGEKKRWSGKK